jgi:hypothetical protein
MYEVAEICFHQDGTVDGLLRDKETGVLVGGRTYFNQHVMVDGTNEQYVILIPVIKYSFRAYDLEVGCRIPNEMVAITGDGNILTRDGEDEPWGTEVIPVLILDNNTINTLPDFRIENE